MPDSESNAVPAQAPSSAAVAPRPETSRPTKQLPPWNVVLLNDDDHTVEYVVALMQQVFAHPVPKGLQIAKTVDSQGRAVCLTTHKELAELKRDQIHAFGADKLVDGCAGSMSAIIEPAEFNEDNLDNADR